MYILCVGILLGKRTIDDLYPHKRTKTDLLNTDNFFSYCELVAPCLSSQSIDAFYYSMKSNKHQNIRKTKGKKFKKKHLQLFGSHLCIFGQ